MTDRRLDLDADPSLKDAGLLAPARPMVMPFARALALLAAFSPEDRWLGNGELALRTGIPASTVSRLVQSLVTLGYLLYEPTQRKCRLALSVLSLGYAAYTNSDVQRMARPQMQSFADEHMTQVILCSRYRLELIVLESCSGPKVAQSPRLHIGAHVSLATSPIGWALLAALPEPERYYLLDNVERRMPREWAQFRRKASEAIAQVSEKGYCSALNVWERGMGIVATPVQIEGQDPRVLACVGPSIQMPSARVDRVLGPHLRGKARYLEQAVESE